MPNVYCPINEKLWFASQGQQGTPLLPYLPLVSFYGYPLLHSFEKTSYSHLRMFGLIKKNSVL
jgi:hypothetical protein